MAIASLGVIDITAIVSAIDNGRQFTNGREFAVWLRLTPDSSGPESPSRAQGLPNGGIVTFANGLIKNQPVNSPWKEPDMETVRQKPGGCFRQPGTDLIRARGN